jgi:hypothetical protein
MTVFSQNLVSADRPIKIAAGAAAPKNPVGKRPLFLPKIPTEPEFEEPHELKLNSGDQLNRCVPQELAV